VTRMLPNNRYFSDMLQRALAAKLPKLAATVADSRILLLEDASMILGLTTMSREINAAEGAHAELAHIDSIWLAHTPLWENKRDVWFFRVWGDGVGERFTIHDG
jgi:hypothetical protein